MDDPANANSAAPPPGDPSAGGSGDASHLDRLRRAKANGSSTPSIGGKKAGPAAGGASGVGKKAAASGGPAAAVAGKATDKLSEKSETAGAALQGAAEGASKGGAGGAALGGIKGLAKTEKGRKILIAGGLAGVLGPLGIIAMAIIVIAGMLSTAGGVANAAATQAAVAAGLDEHELSVFANVAEATGAPWEVIASIRVETLDTTNTADPSATPSPSGAASPKSSSKPTPSNSSSSSASSTSAYIGPFKLKRSSVKKAHVDPKTVMSLEGAATFVAKRFIGSLNDQGFDRTITIDSGRIDGTPGGKPASIDKTNSGAKKVATAYPKAIAAVPIESMDDTMAKRVFQRALTWALGNQYTQDGGGLVCADDTGSDPSSSPSPSKTPKAKASPKPGKSTPAPTPTGTPSSLTVQTTDGKSLTLDSRQLKNAGIVIGVAQQLNINANGIKASLMTALQESKLLVLANSNVPASESDPNKQGSGSDHDSVGIFQQRMGWGPDVKTLMTPTYEAQAFFGSPPNFKNHPKGMIQVSGWQTMDPGVLAQTIQVSAYPDAYNQWSTAATTIMGAVAGIDCADASGSSPLGPNATAQQEATELVKLWQSGRIYGNSGSLADLKATAAGQPISNSSTCGHTIPGIDKDLLRLFLIMTTKFKVEIWNIATGHACDQFYHPTGNATDIGSVTELSTGKHTNFYPGQSNPQVVVDFINFVASSGPTKLAMGQAECSDHAGGGPAYDKVSFDDSCTHQHINVHQNDPQWGPYSNETWPK